MFLATLSLYPQRPLLKDTATTFRCRSMASCNVAIFLCWSSSGKLHNIVFHLLSGSSNGGEFQVWHWAPISQFPASTRGRRIAAAISLVATGYVTRYADLAPSVSQSFW